MAPFFHQLTNSFRNVIYIFFYHRETISSRQRRNKGKHKSLTDCEKLRKYRVNIVNYTQGGWRLI